MEIRFSWRKAAEPPPNPHHRKSGRKEAQKFTKTRAFFLCVFVPFRGHFFLEEFPLAPGPRRPLQ